MKKILSFLFLFIFLGSLFFPLISSAEGLVPCGPGTSKPVCELCDFFVMLDRIMDFLLFRIVPSLAALMIVIGGFLYITSRANPEMLSSAKKLFTSVAYGLLIIYGAFLIIGIFLWLIGLNTWTTDIYHNWWQDGFFQINCH